MNLSHRFNMIIDYSTTNLPLGLPVSEPFLCTPRVLSTVSMCSYLLLFQFTLKNIQVSEALREAVDY